MLKVFLFRKYSTAFNFVEIMGNFCINLMVALGPFNSLSVSLGQSSLLN